jgi:arginyl-tRNA synthetase
MESIMKEAVLEKLLEVVGKLTKEDINIQLSIPKDISNGDFTTNVAFQLGKLSGKSPLEMAKEIAMMLQGEPSTDSASSRQAIGSGKKSSLSERRESKGLDGIEKVEAVAPGFINFYLSVDSLSTNLQEVLNTPEKVAGIRQNPKYPKAIVEYSSPNIAKPFTFGHFRSTIIGDAIANLMEAVGYKVYRDNHLGDWGTQFGKEIYAIKTWGSEEALDKSEDPIKDLVGLYVKFHEEAEKNPQLEEEGRKWFKKLEDGDEEARRLWQKCIDWSFKEFDKIYGELGVHFTENNKRGYGEAFFEGKMQPIIDELEEKKILKDDKGAKLVFFPKDKYPPLMLIKSDGATLYATRDLATDQFRLQHYGKDILVINEVGAEQNLYWKQIFETEYMAGWYKLGQRVHVGHGFVRLKEGKMSTRKGNTIWLADVIEESVSRASKLTKHTLDVDEGTAMTMSWKHGKALEHGMKASELMEVTKMVAIGALKWNDLKRTPHLDIVFDWDEILTMNGNSGPYIQYTYARTQSILKKVHSSLSEQSESKGLRQAQAKNILSQDYTVLEDEKKLMQKVAQFPEIVESAADNYAPNTICEYLFELAQMYNNFYQKYRILNAESDKEKEFRLALTRGVGVIVKQGLYLLGIQAPEKM